MAGSPTTERPRRVAYVLGSHPGDVPTFVLNEMRALVRLGFAIHVFPIHHVPADDDNDPGIFPISAALCELPKILLAHLYFLASRPRQYFGCLMRHRSLGGKRVFLKSPYFARKIQQIGIHHIHAHFGWTATDAARVVSRLTATPYSFTAHAADIYARNDNLAEKLGEAEFVVTCVGQNKAYMGNVFGQIVERKISVVYHGVDLQRFRPPGVSVEADLHILTIGNLVKKKGHRFLIEACGILKQRGTRLRCLIVGEGPERENLLKLIRTSGLEDSVTIEPRRPQSELPSLYARARVFVLATIVTELGDRDGIPNVVAESMAMGLPVISSDLPNLKELVDDGIDGLLVKEKDPGALAASIQRLLQDAGLRSRLGRSARKKMEQKFDARKHVSRLAELFGDRCGKPVRKKPI
ncbi:glycosyltransferase [Elusimicrobiota bacterium]